MTQLKALTLGLPLGLTASIRSSAPFTFGPLERLVLAAYVPGAEILDEGRARDDSDIVIQHRESAAWRMEHLGPLLSLSAQWHGVLPLELFIALYALLRASLIERDFYPAHAVCTGPGAPAVLLTGPSGSGKTTVSLELEQEWGWKTFAGNKSVVYFDDSGLRFLRGTEATTLRSSHAGLLPAPDRALEYFDRFVTPISHEALQGAARSPVRLIAQVRIDPSRKVQSKLSSESATHSLFPIFLDTVNAHVILDAKGVLAPDLHREAQERLLKHLVRTMSSLPVYSLVGSKAFIAECLAELCFVDTLTTSTPRG